MRNKACLVLSVLMCGLLPLAQTGCSGSIDTISDNGLIWERFLNHGYEDCIFCHTGIDKVSISDIGLASAQQQCLSCHTDAKGENCLGCHTGRSLPIGEECFSPTIQGCLKCHSDMRAGTGFFYDDCFLCHVEGLFPVSHHCVDSDLAGCANCHSDMNSIAIDPAEATFANCDGCHVA